MQLTQLDDLLNETYRVVVSNFSAPEYHHLIQQSIQNSQPLVVPRLIFFIAGALDNNSPEDLIPFAAACHMMQLALSIVDDVVDADNQESLAASHGNGPALFTGLAIWISAQQELITFAHRQEHQAQTETLQVFSCVNQAIQKTVLGHLNESLQLNQSYDEQSYLELAAAKSGLFFQMIFRLTAGLVGADEITVQKYAQAGYLLGLLLQVNNDLQSCYQIDLKRNSLYQRQLSLPVIFAAQENPEFRLLWENKAITEIASLMTPLENTGAFQHSSFTLHWLYSQLESHLQPDNIFDQALLKYSRQILQLSMTGVLC